MGETYEAKHTAVTLEFPNVVYKDKPQEPESATGGCPKWVPTGEQLLYCAVALLLLAGYAALCLYDSWKNAELREKVLRYAFGGLFICLSGVGVVKAGSKFLK
eukprot:TRINITY_DN104012_c0_g1_i1.p2 TRINITY_DN104012_c0_g1~~TRINITY_DN104012_c0_g1_i1.p2  ORF type:complete len:111 (-),score=5.58 TRINITY_DN104012_c0_g1_i1:375-683(-)